MRSYLRTSISSLNQNKLRGLLAEIELRTYLGGLGFGGQVSPGGWIARTGGGRNPTVFFPELLVAGVNYAPGRSVQPPVGLHSVATVFRRIGIATYFCSAEVARRDDPASLVWHAQRVGLPQQQPVTDLATSLTGFTPRTRAYKWLRYHERAGDRARRGAGGVLEGAPPREYQDSVPR